MYPLTRCLTAVILLILIPALSAQDCEWTTSRALGGNLSEDASASRAVHMFDPQTAAVAAGGGITRLTADGGESWEDIEDPTGVQINAYSFLSENLGYAAGAQGRVQKTTDGGISWEILETGTNNFLNGIHFINDTAGWAVGSGGLILRTDNGGESWEAQPSGSTAILNGVFFLDSLNGYVVGNGLTNLVTADGGATWTTGNMEGTGSLQAIVFVNSTTGFAVGSGGRVRRTVDGGTTWTETTLAGISVALLSVYFHDENKGWITSNDGRIFYTLNGGDDWEEAENPTEMTLSALHFADELNGTAAGQSGVILKSTDGGLTWEYSLLAADNFRDVAYLSDNSVLAVGTDGTIFASDDGGIHWTARESGTTRELTAIKVLSENEAWVVGNIGTALHTTDGGLTWESATTGTNSFLRAVDFVGPLKGWAVGSTGMIRHTDDGGETWTQQASGTTQELQAVRFLSENIGYAGGFGNVMLRTADGGQNWTPISPGYPQNVMAIRFADQDIGFTAGTNGVMSNTVDGGETWTELSINTTLWLYDLYFITPQQGWVVGTSGLIRSTEDGGASWEVIPPVSNQPYYGVDFRNAGKGIAAGGLDIRLYNCCEPAFGEEVYNGCTGDGYSVTVGSTVFDEANPEGTVILPQSANAICDSTVTVSLNFGLPPPPGIDVVDACNAHSWIDGQTYTESTDQPEFVIIGGAANGCDSTVTLDLTVTHITAEFHPVIDGGFTAIQEDAEYQWLECDGDETTLIPGATENEFIPASVGFYALQVSVNGCTETSECTFFSGVNTENAAEPGFICFPNPAREEIYIRTEGRSGALTFVLYDAAGRPMKSILHTGADTVLPISELAAGLYILHSTALGGPGVRVIKE